MLSLADDVAKKLGLTTISQAEFAKQAGTSYRPIHRLFGSWESFAREAGFELHPAYKRRIPDEELFGEFFRITSELGRFPSYQDLSRSNYSVGTFERRFGNYSGFKMAAMAYGIQQSLIQPEVAEQEVLKPHRQKEATPAYERLQDHPILGERIDFRGLIHAPVNELGVVYLFGILSQELGFVVESVQSEFPDCHAKRRLPKDKWQTVRIEFEYKSSNFLGHKHDLTGCDMIVCWQHDWSNCPLEVLSLGDFVKKNKH